MADQTIDASIPLAAKAPAPFSLGTSLGPLLDIQNKMNENRLFQQTFAAKQRAGQILSSVDPNDPEAGIRGLMSDPLTAPFSGEIIGQIRGAQKTLLDMQGQQQTQAQSGLDAVLKALPAGMADPSQLDSAIKMHMSTLSPTAQARVAPAVESLKHSLLDGLPDDPAQAQKVFQTRIGGHMISAGFTPDSLRAITGQLAPTVESGPYGPGGAQKPVVIGGPAAGPANPLSPLGAGANPGAGTNRNALMPEGPTQEQTAANTAAGGVGGAVSGEMSDLARGLPTVLKRMDNTIDALGGFQSGGGANIRTSVAKAIQAVKNAGAGDYIPQNLVDAVGNQNLGATELFNANIKPFVTEQLREAATGSGAGRIRAEVEAFLKSADATTDPATLMRIFNQARYHLQVGYDQSQKFVDFKQALGRKDPSVAGLGESDFFPYYAKNFGSKPLPTSNAGGGLDLGPKPTATARGAVPDKLRGVSGLHYNAGRNQFKDANGTVYDADGNATSVTGVSK